MKYACVPFVTLLACQPNTGNWEVVRHDVTVIECIDREFEAFTIGTYVTGDVRPANQISPPFTGAAAEAGRELYRLNRIDYGVGLSSPFNPNTVHSLRKNNIPFSFDFELSGLQWPGGDTTMACDDTGSGTFSCGFTDTEWLREPDTDSSTQQKSERFTEVGQCVSQLETPETQTCWQRGISAAGSFSGETMTVEHSYFLTCLQGASCLLNPITNHCAATITTEYEFLGE